MLSKSMQHLQRIPLERLHLAGGSCYKLGSLTLYIRLGPDAFAASTTHTGKYPPALALL